MAYVAQYGTGRVAIVPLEVGTDPDTGEQVVFYNLAAITYFWVPENGIFNINNSTWVPCSDDVC